MPDFGGAGGQMPSKEQMEKAMQQMDTLLDSNFVEDYFSDDEKLEKARLNMLENLDQYGKIYCLFLPLLTSLTSFQRSDNAMPGFKEQAREIASSPEKW